MSGLSNDTRCILDAISQGAWRKEIAKSEGQLLLGYTLTPLTTET